MGSETYPLRCSGIYRNLPTFDPSIKGLKALVCGATGISGIGTMRALLDSPERWSKVYAISRSPLKEDVLGLFTPEQRSRIQHVSIDLAQSPDAITKAIQDAGVSADYVFYYTYLEPKLGFSALDPRTAGALRDTNVPLFDNLLQALPKAQLRPRRIVLQTGGKNYGQHIGRTRTPVVESDPQPKHLAPNFYYDQEKLLFDFCAANPETSWNIIHPAGIIGAAPAAAMNFMYSFGVYAAVQAQKNEPLVFGGDFESWQYECTSSSARLTGYLTEWAALEAKCENQRFNAQDNSPFSWDRFFHELARWYGVSKGVKGPEEDESQYTSYCIAGGKDSPLGYGPSLEAKYSYRLKDWFQDPINMQAWEKIAQDSAQGVKYNPFETGMENSLLGDFSYIRFASLSGNKVRRFGFTGFVDTLESVFEMFQDMASMGMLPPMKVDSTQLLV